jgi:hypothetical protein
MEVGVARLGDERDGEGLPTVILNHSTRLSQRPPRILLTGKWFAVGTDSSPGAQNDNPNATLSVIPAGGKRGSILFTSSFSLLTFYFF